MQRLRIINGTLVNPAGVKKGLCDLLIEDGVIRKISENAENTDVKNGECNSVIDVTDHGDIAVIDAKGMLIAPGLVDVHVHFRDPGLTYKEDIMSGSRAAAKGGYTSVVMMANTKPVIDRTETLSYVLEEGKKTGIHVYSCACVTQGMSGEKLTDMSELFQAGAAGFTDDGKPIMDEELVREAMLMVRQLDVPISFHEEDPTLITNNGVNRGVASEHFGIGGSPREAETTMIARDLQLALETGAKINIQHISSKEGVELVREAKKHGRNIHAEATPHHFTLTEEAVIQYGTLAKMNPPLRTEEDRQAIIQGLQDGTIDLIATDHAPHSEEEKAQPLTQAPSGIIGLETAFPLAITELVHTGKLTIEQVIERMSVAPARLYHLPAGVIEEGAPADLIIFDDKAKAVMGNYASKAKNTPFTGRELEGVIHTTICGGVVVSDNE